MDTQAKIVTCDDQFSLYWNQRCEVLRDLGRSYWVKAIGSSAEFALPKIHARVEEVA